MSWSKSQVISLLRENQDERGVTHWQKRAKQATGLSSFGIGLTKLRKLAKQIGREPKLAAQLWKSDIYDAKVIAILIDDPKAISKEQAERQVEQINAGMLSHVFASCDAPLAKSPIAFELAEEWMNSQDEVRRRCGYSLLYELSKRKVKAMDDDYCLQRIADIREHIHDEPMWVREAMNTALMGLGKRNKTLNQAAIKAAKAIGPVQIDYGDDNQCQPLDVLKHLTSDYVKNKFAK
ncbi:DNA alkylation repair protein [Roseiconus nitratireducens]|uniref:DNA alkylation repair protein n=2 Tax=Roseiconus nitratireducens TaxID=2605748 RepID=A0A5M6CW21_9BACT|nr:DNA alkylation repair protein [Roseiconus nitratireducens]